MLYQKILMEEEPFQLRLGRMKEFAEHRHADIEFNFCVKGSFDIEIEKKRYRVSEGEMTLISPMLSHAFPSSDAPDNLVLTAIVGPTFLRRYFGTFSRAAFPFPILNTDAPERESLRQLLSETAALYHDTCEQAQLLRMGNLYKICAHLIGILNDAKSEGETPKKDLRVVANIEKALELIHYSYKEPLTVDDAAAVTGYGKSNFCKLFKSITGESFHASLNRHRIRTACGLLSETNMSVSAIAQEVGFGEPKTFCRIFRAELGMTPGEYRRLQISSGGGES